MNKTGSYIEYHKKEMASIQREHYFLPGRKSKNGGPGILVVEGQYKFRKNKAKRKINL